MRLFHRDKTETQEEHAAVEHTLKTHERRLDEMQTRLDNLKKRVDVIHPEEVPKET